MINEELVLEIKNGKANCLFQLWLQCYGFVHQQAIRWMNAWGARPDYDVEDLVQSGFLAMRKAIDGFQAERGGSFIGYLDFYLKTEFAQVVGCRTTKQQNDIMKTALSFESPAYGNRCEDGKRIGDMIEDPTDYASIVEEKVFSDQV